MNIISRAEWGARPPKSVFKISLPTPKLWLHHTVSPTGGAARIRAIQDFHMDERGWSDIAYSFLINAEGTIYQGRGPGVAGGHTAGQNTVSHAICLLGNFDQIEPTPAALSATVELARFGFEKGWWPQTFTGGHRDAPLADTSCPGAKLYALLPGINEQLEDDMPTIEEIREAIRSETPGAVLGAEFGGPVGSSKRKSLSLHVLEIKSLIGVLDSEGVSEAELNEAADRIIALVPDEVLVRLKAKL